MGAGRGTRTGKVGLGGIPLHLRESRAAKPLANLSVSSILPDMKNGHCVMGTVSH